MSLATRTSFGMQQSAKSDMCNGVWEHPKNASKDSSPEETCASILMHIHLILSACSCCEWLYPALCASCQCCLRFMNTAAGEDPTKSGCRFYCTIPNKASRRSNHVIGQSFTVRIKEILVMWPLPLGLGRLMQTTLAIEAIPNCWYIYGSLLVLPICLLNCKSCLSNDMIPLIS